MSESSNSSCDPVQSDDVTSDVNVEAGEPEASTGNTPSGRQPISNREEGILRKIRWLTCLILLQNVTGVVLCFVFLINTYFVNSVCTLLGIAAPIIILYFISKKWDQYCETNSLNLFKLFLTIFNKCKDAMTLFEDSDVKKKLQCIENLRFSAATFALVHGAGQCAVQTWLLTHSCDEYTLPAQIAVEILSVLLILCFILVNRKGFCDFRSDLGICRVSILTYFLTLMTMVLYVADILSDFGVTFQYYWYLHYIRGTATLVSTIGPGIFVTWLEHDDKIRPFTADVKQIVSMILNLNPFIGYWKSVELLQQTRKAEVEQDAEQQKTSYTEYIQNNFNVARSTYNVCLTESCSQLIIQISGLLPFIQILARFSALEYGKFAIFSTVISVLNICVSLVLTLRSWRIKNYKEDPVPIHGMVLHFIGYLPVASRILALSLLASVHPFYTFLCMFVHWLLVLFWRVYYHKDTSLSGYLFNAGAAVGDIYAPPVGNVRIRTFFRSVFLIEDIAVILVWSFSEYEGVATSATYLLVFAIVLSSTISWICTYLYMTMEPKWIDKYVREQSERILNP